MHFVAAIGSWAIGLGCFMSDVAVLCLAVWPRFTCVAMLFPMSVITNMNRIIVKRIHLKKKLYIFIKTCTSKNCACWHNNTDEESKCENDPYFTPAYYIGQ